LRRAKKVLFDPNFKPPDLRPKITDVVISRREVENKRSEEGQAQKEAKGKAKKKPKHRTGKGRV
jgi:hypothetical protein